MTFTKRFGRLIVHVGNMNNEEGDNYIPSLAVRWKGTQGMGYSKDIRISRNGIRIRRFA